MKEYKKSLLPLKIQYINLHLHQTASTAHLNQYKIFNMFAIGSIVPIQWHCVCLFWPVTALLHLDCFTFIFKSILTYICLRYGIIRQHKMRSVRVNEAEPVSYENAWNDAAHTLSTSWVPIYAVGRGRYSRNVYDWQ